MTLDETTEKRKYEKLRAFDRIEIAGHKPVNSSIASVLSEGEVLADDGNQYSSIQNAIDASDSWVFVGPGTYYENVIIDRDDFTLRGAGRETVIDGGEIDDGITPRGNNINIESIGMKTSSSSPQTYNRCINSNSSISNIRIKGCHFLESDHAAIRINNMTDSIIANCRFESGINSPAITADMVRGIIANCHILGNGGNGIRARGDDMIITNNIINSVGNIGIHSNANDQIIGGNRIINSSNDGIRISNTDTIIFNNRISDSGGANINDSGTGTVLDSNLTGAAN